MATMTQISVRIDSETKEAATQVLDEIGMSLSTAINIFLKRVGRDRRIPFELSADPFYGPENMAHLEGLKCDADAGRTRYESHGLFSD